MTLAEWSRKLKRRSPVPGLPSLLFLTDRRRVPDPAAVIRSLPRGSAVIFRDYDLPDRAALAASLCRLCHRRGIVFLVAGDRRLAQKVRADGLHLPEHALKRRFRSPRPGWLVTASAHSPAAIRRAGLKKVDAVLVSPVFATASHPSAAAIGRRTFATWARRAALPVYALGGVTPGHARSLSGLKLAGIAGIGLFSR